MQSCRTYEEMQISFQSYFSRELCIRLPSIIGKVRSAWQKTVLSLLYMQREFSHAIVVCTFHRMPYYTLRVTWFHSTVARLQTQHTDALCSISGNFNHVSLDFTLSDLSVCGLCNKEKWINYARTIIKIEQSMLTWGMHTALSSWPHWINLTTALHVFSQGTSTQVQRQPITTRIFRRWTSDAEDALRVCFESTDYSVLQKGPRTEAYHQMQLTLLQHYKKFFFY